MLAQRHKGTQSSQNHQQEEPRGGGAGEATQRDHDSQADGPSQHSEALRVLPGRQTLLPSH